MWNRGPLKILNGIKLILDDQGNHLDSYAINLESFRSFRGPLFRKPVTGQELFFAVSYSKPALARNKNVSVKFRYVWHFKNISWECKVKTDRLNYPIHMHVNKTNNSKFSPRPRNLMHIVFLQHFFSRQARLLKVKGYMTSQFWTKQDKTWQIRIILQKRTNNNLNDVHTYLFEENSILGPDWITTSYQKLTFFVRISALASMGQINKIKALDYIKW